MPAEPPPRRPSATAPHGAPPQGEDQDKKAFRAQVEPHLDELLAAAARELEYRQAIGDLGLGDLTAEELVGETLTRAWRDRDRRPPLLGLRPWLLGLMFRVADNLARQEARRREAETVSLEARVPPGPVSDDDEGFWDWYQPDESTRWEDVIPASAATPEQIVAVLERAEGRALPQAARRLLLLTRVHRLSVAEAASALHIPVAEATRLLVEAHRAVGGRERRA